MYDPKQFLGKRVYNDSKLELLRTTVMCKTLTEAERYNIMEQAVAPCPEITMIIKGQKVQALVDMGSQVTLMNESYFVQNIQQLLLTVDKDHLNAHKLFNLKGVEDGCVPLTKYFSVDIQVGGRLIHDIGVLVKKDNIPLTDSKGRSTRTPAILGCKILGWKSSLGIMVRRVLNCLNVQLEWTLCTLVHCACISTLNAKRQSIKLALLKKTPNLKVGT